MIWASIALLLILGLVGWVTSTELIGGAIQIILICAVVALVISRIRRFKMK